MRKGPASCRAFVRPALSLPVATFASSGRGSGDRFNLANLADLLKNHLYVPTLVIQGDDDQIVPIRASGLMSSKIVKGATLKIYPGAPHGLCSTLKDQVNADLLAFIRT